MCGILAVFGVRASQVENTANAIRKKFIKLQKLLRHRGPDWSGIYIKELPDGSFNILCHERLAIVDLENGEQPLKDETETLYVTVNGEIYNHKALRALVPGYKYLTNSDCECIIPLYKNLGPDMLHKLNGMFAFVYYDASTGAYFAARDAIGVIPLYYGRSRDGSMWFSSELKALEEDCPSYELFPPGHYYESTKEKLTRWYNPSWFAEIPSKALDLKVLRDGLTNAVKRQLMSDVPYGVLLSGGLDSSLICSIASRLARSRQETDGVEEAWWPRLHSFSIGLKGSPDLKFAREVASFIKTVHHEWTFTVAQGIDALSDVIQMIETYDVTTIRASTPMYLMARRIKAMGVKMVLSGEGADEIFGGYLYFHKAPNPTEFHKETVRKVQDLHKFDCLRANKSTSAWGVEVRPPFLDTDFLDIAMNINPAEKMIDKSKGRIEKYILRSAFDTPDQPYLPKSVLWRQKEQFSDGVGYGWIDGLKEYAETHVTDAEMSNAVHAFPINPPRTKEAYYYRSLYEKHFPSPSAAKTVPYGPSVACSTATAIEWDESFKKNADPSGRAVLGVHDCDSSKTEGEPKAKKQRQE